MIEETTLNALRLNVELGANDLIDFIRNTSTYFSEYTNGKGELKTITHYVSLETRNAMADAMSKIAAPNIV